MNVTYAAPWLIADLNGPHCVLSWALNRPGFATARRIVFREVRNRDLPENVDAARWLDDALTAADLSDAPALLTSRAVRSYQLTEAHAGEVTANCLATVGFSNAERVGHRHPLRHPPEPARFGTINIAARLSAALTEAAHIEALTIAAEARTAAVMDAGVALPQGLATGTSTDCIALACPPAEHQPRTTFAGLHTDVGEALGRSVYDAVSKGAADWLATRPDLETPPDHMTEQPEPAQHDP